MISPLLPLGLFLLLFFLLCLLVFQLQTQLSTEFGDQALPITILDSWFPIRFYQQGSLKLAARGALCSSISHTKQYQSTSVSKKKKSHSD